MKKITLFSIMFILVCSSKAFAISTLPFTGVLSPAIPADWTYITNDPGFPNPSFYTTAGAPGFKLSFENQGISTPEFTPSSAVSVTLNVNALNQNTKTGTNTNYFTIKGLNSNNDVVATAYLTTVIKGENKVEIIGSDIVKVKIVMTGYPNDGTKFCNVNLASVTISEKSSGVNSPKANSFNVAVVGKKLVLSNVTNGSTVEIYTALGSKVQSSELVDGSVVLNKLSKGLYIVRVGKQSQKFML